MGEHPNREAQSIAAMVWEFSGVAREDGELAYVSVRPGAIGHRGHVGQTEFYYVLAGTGWLMLYLGAGEIVRLSPGVSVEIPAGVDYQFRADGGPQGASLELLVPSAPRVDPGKFVATEPQEWGAGNAPPTAEHRPTANVVRLPAAPDYAAPDHSAIRVLAGSSVGGISFCSLPTGTSTEPVTHRTVTEIWFVVGGYGALWRVPVLPDISVVEEQGEVAFLRPGTAVDVPLGAAFQFRSLGVADLEILIFTFPGWPGSSEAIPVPQARRWDLPLTQ